MQVQIDRLEPFEMGLVRDIGVLIRARIRLISESIGDGGEMT